MNRPDDRLPGRPGWTGTAMRFSDAANGTYHEPQAGTVRQADLAEILAENENLRDENLRLQHALTGQHRLVEQLRQQCASTLGARPGAKRDRIRSDSATHITLADRYRDLVAQDIHHLVRRHVAEGLGRTTPHRIAQEINTLCRMLFLETDHEVSRVCHSLGMGIEYHADMGHLLRKTADLRRHTDEVTWDLQAIGGRRLNPDTQQAWDQCNPVRTIEFAVAPAYRLGGRIYAKQQVFTKARGPFWSR